jgi:hypothetical protein
MSGSECPSVAEGIALTIASNGGRGPRLPVPVLAAAAYSTAGRGLLKRGLKAWGLSAGTNWGVSAAVLAAGAVNVAVLGYIAHKLYRSCVVQLETYQQLRCSHERCWQLATQVSTNSVQQLVMVGTQPHASTCECWLTSHAESVLLP